MADGIGVRLVLLAIYIPAGIIFTMRYAEKIRKDPTKSLVYAQAEENKKFFLKSDMDNLPELTAKRKLILVVFVVSFLVMIWGVLAWEDLGITIWPTMGWWFPELSGIFLVASIVVAVIDRMGEETYMDTFLNGCKDLLSVAVIIGVARGVSIVMNDAMITDTILHAGETLLSNVPSVIYSTVSYLFYFVMSFIIPSSSGLATLSMGIMAPLADFAGVARHVIVIGFSSANAIVSFLAPTCGLLMGVLAMCKIPLSKWLRFVWKLVAMIMAATILIMAIATMVGL